MISFQIITVTEAGGDGTKIRIAKDDDVIIVWKGNGIDLPRLRIVESTWPYPQPAMVTDDPKLWTVAYKNNREPFGIFSWTFGNDRTTVPPEIINEGGGGGGGDRR